MCWAWVLPLEACDGQEKYLHAPILRGAQLSTCPAPRHSRARPSSVAQGQTSRPKRQSAREGFKERFLDKFLELILVVVELQFCFLDRETDKQTKPNNLMELFHGNETEDTLKIVQHGSTIIFILVVIIVLGVYLKQGNMTKEINYGFLVFSIILLLFSIYVYFISVENSHKRTRDSTYNIAAQELDSKLSVSK